MVFDFGIRRKRIFGTAATVARLFETVSVA
jgi:hypothetical protein